MKNIADICASLQNGENAIDAYNSARGQCATESEATATLLAISQLYRASQHLVRDLEEAAK